eukprot:403362473
MYQLDSQNKNQCEAADPEKIRNQLSSRAFIMQYPANEPCEDRFNCYQFKNFDGYYAAVFDGHGGWQLSEYAMKKLHVYMDEALKGAKTDKQIIEAMNQAFNRVENDWIECAKASFDRGFPQSAYVGSCALVAIVHDNKLYVANAGDSKGVLLRTKPDGSFEPINISKTFNANKLYEQERLKAQFKNEKDIVRCRNNDSKACYVKGGLMPTRSFGDLRLKKNEFNSHGHPLDLGYRKPIPEFTGPYITHEPDVQVFDLTKDDQYFILASDGLWDEIKRRQAAEFVKGNDKDLKSIAAILFEKALENVAKTNHISREFISQAPPGKHKRQYIDDITIVILNLKNQTK